jgi:hypothetical protein
MGDLYDGGSEDTVTSSSVALSFVLGELPLLEFASTLPGCAGVTRCGVPTGGRIEYGISVVAKETRPTMSTKVATPAATPFQKRARASAR